MFSGLLDRNKTFRPKHKFTKGSTQHDLHQLAKETLGSGDLSEAVKLPPGENLNEWLAIHTVDFYNTSNLLYGSLNEFCTKDTCPTMSAGSKYEYFWMDKQKYKRPTKLPAPEYVANLMDWIAVQINNEEVFPTDPSRFKEDFKEEIKNIFKRMFRVYAHIYYSHYKDAQKLQVDRHLNTAFKHFVLFVLEFDLVDKKELQPLKSTIFELVGRTV